jgi:cbb3-type cytochrome oxidase subunit 3
MALFSAFWRAAKGQFDSAAIFILGKAGKMD